MRRLIPVLVLVPTIWILSAAEPLAEKVVEPTVTVRIGEMLPQPGFDPECDIASDTKEAFECLRPAEDFGGDHEEFCAVCHAGM